MCNFLLFSLIAGSCIQVTFYIDQIICSKKIVCKLMDKTYVYSSFMSRSSWRSMFLTVCPNLFATHAIHLMHTIDICDRSLFLASRLSITGSNLLLLFMCSCFFSSCATIRVLRKTTKVHRRCHLWYLLSWSLHHGCLRSILCVYYLVYDV